MNDQKAKHDADKIDLTLVPRQIVYDIARVREFGVKKYKDPENWKNVSDDRYIKAAYRHFYKFLDNPHGLDEESGLPHLWHLACNIAFLCERFNMVKEDENDEEEVNFDVKEFLEWLFEDVKHS